MITETGWNPMGSCYDSVAHQVAAWIAEVGVDGLADVRVIHAIGHSNLPVGEKSKLVTHAWIEKPFKDNELMALDCIHGVMQPAPFYRKNFKVEYEISYTVAKYIELWAKYNFPGPWDRRLKKVQKALGR